MEHMETFLESLSKKLGSVDFCRTLDCTYRIAYIYIYYHKTIS